MGAKVEATDAEILRMLELRDQGLSFGQIAERMRNFSRSAILGQVHRVQNANEPDEFDGTMPYGWWKEGLRKQNG